MKRLLAFAVFLLFGLALHAQPIQRNFFTTNPAPIVDVVAGSNVTVAAAVPTVNHRQFTVNGAVSHAEVNAASNTVWTYANASSNALWIYNTGVSNAQWAASNALNGYVGGVSNNVITTSNVLWVYTSAASNALWIYSTGISNSAWFASNSLAGKGGSGIDLTRSDLQPFSNGTNFALDFGWQSLSITNATNICFRYSTNWPGSSATSRMVSVRLPLTSVPRTISFSDDATNWHGFGFPYLMTVPTNIEGQIFARIYGPGETNVDLVWASATPVPNATGTGLDPRTIPGITYWFEGGTAVYLDAGTTPTTNGGPVAMWKDQSGLAHDLQMTAAANQVTWLANGGPNSRAAVKCTVAGAGNSLTNLAGTVYGQPNWFFLVCNNNAGAANEFLFSSATATRCEFNWNAGAGSLYAGGSLAGFNTIFGSQFVLLSFKFDTVGIIRTNGIQAASGGVGANAFSQMMLFNFGISPTYSLNGAIAELIGYNANLAGTDVTNIERYLAVKYNIPGP